MTNLKRKPQIETPSFEVIEGGRSLKKPVERLLGAALLVGGGLVLLLEADATALIFLSFIAIPMLFSKKSVIIK